MSILLVHLRIYHVPSSLRPSFCLLSTALLFYFICFFVLFCFVLFFDAVCRYVRDRLEYINDIHQESIAMVLRSLQHLAFPHDATVFLYLSSLLLPRFFIELLFLILLGYSLIWLTSKIELLSGSKVPKYSYSFLLLILL